MISRVAATPPLARHVQIHQYHVRSQALGEGYGFDAIRRLADDLDVGFERQHQRHATADQRLIVDDQHADTAAVGRRFAHLDLAPPVSASLGNGAAPNCSRMRPTTGEGRRAVK